VKVSNSELDAGSAVAALVALLHSDDQPLSAKKEALCKITAQLHTRESRTALAAPELLSALVQSLKVNEPDFLQSVAELFLAIAGEPENVPVMVTSGVADALYARLGVTSGDLQRVIVSTIGKITSLYKALGSDDDASSAIALMEPEPEPEPTPVVDLEAEGARVWVCVRKRAMPTASDAAAAAAERARQEAELARTPERLLATLQQASTDLEAAAALDALLARLLAETDPAARAALACGACS
jgi:hypothetical protein